jgi:hypothetical protein
MGTIDDPFATIPTFYAGPFRAWAKKYYGVEQMISFGDLVKSPRYVASNAVGNADAGLPLHSLIIAIVDDHDRVIVVDGMHRCSTIASIANSDIHPTISIDIAYAKFHGVIPWLGQEHSPT